MPHIIRRILFIAFFTLFFIAGVSILFYSTGYRYHFAKHKIEKTGQFAVDARPRDVEIFIDGRKMEQPFRSFFRLPKLSGKERVISILSGQYSLRLSKEGYFDWSQQISIVPGQRLVLQDIYLIRREQPRFTSSDTVLKLPSRPKIPTKTKDEELVSLLQQRSIISDEYENALIVRSDSGAELIKKLPQGIYRASRLGDISTVRWVDRSQFFGFNDFEIWSVSLKSDTQPHQLLITRHSEKISDPILFPKKGFLAYILDGKKIILIDIRQPNALHQYTLVEGAFSDIDKNDSNELLFVGEHNNIRGAFTLPLFED